MFTHPTIRSILDHDDVLGTLPPARRAELAREARKRWVPLGGALWRVGEPAQQVMFVLSGVVAVTTVGPSGASVAVEFGGSGDRLDIASAFGPDTRVTTAFALTRVAVFCEVPRGDLTAALEAHPRATLALAAHLAAHLAATRGVLSGLSSEIETRMARVVMALSSRFGVTQPDGSIALAIPFPRGDMARLVGTTAETVIRVFSRWRSLGYIRSSSVGIDVVDAAAIQRLASSGVFDHPAIETARTSRRPRV